MKRYLVFILCCSVACPSIAALHDSFIDFGNDVSDLCMKDNRFETEDEKKVREIFKEMVHNFNLNKDCLRAALRQAFCNVRRHHGSATAMKCFEFGIKEGILDECNARYAIQKSVK